MQERIFLHDGISRMELALFLDDIGKYHGKKVIEYSFWIGANDNGTREVDRIIKKKEIFADKEFTYLYFGSEFCEYKIPGVAQVKEFLEVCKRDNLVPVFVTPMVTDYGIEKIRECLNVLMVDCEDLSIVVSDYGVLELLYKTDSTIHIIAGRVLDKLSHESRATIEELYDYYGQAGLEYAVSPGILSAIHRYSLKKYGIERYEYDVPKVGFKAEKTGLHYSVYWPFSYITTGRVCPFRAMEKEGYHKFLVGSPCTGRCKDMIIEKRSAPDNTGKPQYLFQAGNTVFYISDFDQIESIFQLFDRMILQIL